MEASGNIDQILSELRELRQEVARLHVTLRPARVRYRPSELGERLGVSRQHVYDLWNAGKLGYRKDERGRFSTEADVLEYEAIK